LAKAAIAASNKHERNMPDGRNQIIDTTAQAEGTLCLQRRPLVRLANEAKDPRQALQLAERAHQIAIEAVSPKIFGHVFAADEGEEGR
jgi:hypothetical protein